MGQMKRAEARERLRRKQLAQTHFVVLRWRKDADHLVLEVVDPHTQSRLTKQRIIREPATIYNLVQRSLTGTTPGPRTTLLRKDLDLGVGSITIEITGEQYLKLREPKSSEEINTD